MVIQKFLPFIPSGGEDVK